jgi:hypothetical protein
MTRDILIQHLKTATANSSYKVSDQLPFNNAQTPLYERNFKTLYVSDRSEVTQPLIQLLNATNIPVTDFELTVTFATDAKAPAQANTAPVYTILRNATSVFANTISTQVEITSEIQDDIQITTAVYDYRTIVH